MNKVAIAMMTFAEFQELAKGNPPVLIPMGSVEEHGPQNPMGDYVLAEKIAHMVCERTGCILTPSIPFSYSEYFRKFPGTTTLRPETLFYLAEDVCNSLIYHGLDHLIFFNGHRGNNPILEHLGRKIRAEKGI
ncbi:MAG: creatininase family protein, partial [bacterium]